MSGTAATGQTFSITVTDPKVVTQLADAGLIVAENATATLTSAELGYSDDGAKAVDGPGQRGGYHLHADDVARRAVRWKLSGVRRQRPHPGRPSPRHNVTYVQGGGDGNDSFAFSVSDDGGAAATGTFSITVSDPQVVSQLADAGLSVAENATATLTSAELGYSDDGGAVTGPGASEVVYTVTTLPTGGTLKLSGTALALNGTFTQANVNNSRVSYVQGGGDGNDSFAFSAYDRRHARRRTGTFAVTVTDPKALCRRSGRRRAEPSARNATATLTKQPSWLTATTAGAVERTRRRRTMVIYRAPRRRPAAP